jgi:hypothetical protein
MVNVNLPALGLVGEWTVTDPERALAAHLLRVLPAEPPGDTDQPTRFVLALRTMMAVKDVLHENNASLFNGRTEVRRPAGHTDMISWMYDITRKLNETETVGRLMTGDAAASWMADWLSQVEPELAELRRLLSETAS